MLSCEVSHPSLGHPLWVKAMLNVGCMYEPKFNLFLICKIFKSIKVSEDMLEKHNDGCRVQMFSFLLVTVSGWQQIYDKDMIH